MSKAQKPNTWSEQAAIAWIRTRDEKFAREASGDGDVRLELKLAIWKNAGKSLHKDNLTAARDALHVKVGKGSIRKSGFDYWIEDVVREFPPGAHVPASLAEVHDKQKNDTSKVVKGWRPKRGHKLTASEYAIFQVLNELWPGGQLDHKAAARDDLIIERLLKQGRSRVSPRTIQRALKKIHFR
jgi:hypothetical protein